MTVFLVASFRSCALSCFFLLHLLWLSIMQLRHYLFIGTLNTRLTRLAHSDVNLGNSARVLFFILTESLAASPPSNHNSLLCSPTPSPSVSQYTNAFAFTQLCGVLCAPWNGLIMDRHKGKPANPGKTHRWCQTCVCVCLQSAFPPEGETEREANLRSSCLSLFLTSLQCLLFSTCASVPFLPLQYLTFVLQVLNRSFMYGGSAAFISIT